MQSTLHAHSVSSASSASAPRGVLLATTLLAAVATATLVGSASGGDIVPPPGGTVHDWTGAAGAFWNVAGNWNTMEVPGNGDSAIVLGGPFGTIFLTDDSAELGSLFVGGGRILTNNANVLRVTSGPAASTTVSGLGSAINVLPVAPGVAGVDVDNLVVTGGGRLRMFGGEARILSLDLEAGGRIVGRGRLEINGPGLSAFDGLDGGPLEIGGGDLTIHMVNLGGIAMPDTIEFTDEGRTLHLQGPLTTPLWDVDLGMGGTLDIQHPWEHAGTLVADSAAGDSARIIGGPALFDGDIEVDTGGRLDIESSATFGSTGTATVAGAGATLEIASSAVVAEPGHLIMVSNGGRLVMSGNPLSDWEGDIQLAPNATMEVNDPIGSWQVAGDLRLSGFSVLRSRIIGTAPVQATGLVAVNGSGGDVDGALDMAFGSTLDLELASTELRVGGLVRLRGGSETIGGGAIVIEPSGTLRIDPTADVAANVENDGVLVLGGPDGPDYVYLDGALDMDAPGELRIDIFGPAPADRDVLETAGTAQMDGELRVELQDGYVPAIGTAFFVVQSNVGVTGTFDAITGSPGFEVSYGPMDVTVTYVGEDTCPADLTGDGVADLADMLAVLASWGPCDGCPADLDGDGAVGIADLLVVLSGWGSCD